MLASEILLVSEPNAIKQLPPMALAAGPLAHRGHKAPKGSVSVGCPLAQHMAAGGGGVGMELSEHLTSLVLALVFFGNLPVGNRTHRVAAPPTQLSGRRSEVATRWQ